MALYFNLKTLEEQANNVPNTLYMMLYHHYTKELPSRRNYKLFSKVSLHGSSFILNPRALFEDKTTDILYKIQYIKLAGRRDYNLFKQYGYKRLQTSFYPDLNLEAICHNPLLSITPTEIIFKPEESK